MIVLRTFITSFTSIAVLFLLTKLIGNRQISELSAFDYINSITIGSIAAELATTEFDGIISPLVAMIIYGFVTFLLSVISNKSIAFRSFIEGKTIVIMKNGKIITENMKKAHLDINELLENCRISGYFDISMLDTVFLEANGKLSFIAKSEYSQPKISDLKTDILNETKQEKPTTIIVSDGILLQKNLISAGYNEEWLHKELEKQKTDKIEEIFLASVTDDGVLSCYFK